MRQRLNVIRREYVNVDRATHSGRRSRQDIGIRREVGGELIRRHVNPFWRQARSSQVAKCPPVEVSVPATHEGPAALIQPVRKSEARCPVIFIAVDPAGVDSDRGEARIWILYA